MNVEILRTQCCGSGFCVEIAPDVFALDSKQRSVVIDAGAAPLELLLEAAEACPCGAIVVEEEVVEMHDESAAAEERDELDVSELRGESGAHGEDE
jgi:ferredoxin